MKYILTIVSLLIAQLSFSQQMNYKEWQEQAKIEIRLLPEYGNVEKTKEQKEADDELIRTELTIDTTHRKASEHLVRVGFDYLYRGDPKTAMYRFNQAWLLDPKNENAYWGFASLYFSFNDYDEALKQLNKGLLINPNSSNILTDVATVYIGYYANKHSVSDLNKAIEIFNRSYKIDPLNQNTLFKLSAAYYYKSDCTNARKFYNECEKLGGQPITPEYTNALKKMCAN
ncbi:MAG: hypothetical protein JWP37_3253 [Mucilaginibacter sp.]|nr:hypothetical protein [Mucilaginibacter sp.]